MLLGPLLAASAAFTWAVSNISIRRDIDKVGFLAVSLILTVTGIAFFTPLALAFTVPQPDFRAILVFLLAGFIQPGITRILYYTSVEKLGVTLTSSLTSSSPIFSALFAYIMLGEKASYTLWLGILLVVLGSILIQLSISHEIQIKSFNVRYFVYPFASAIFGGIGYVTRKYGLNIWNVPIVGILLGYISTLILYCLVFIALGNKSNVSISRHSLGLLWKPSIGIAIGHLFSFYALAYTDVSIVTSFQQMQPLFIIILARRYLAKLEIINLKLIIGTIAIMCGTILVLIA